MYKIEIYNSKDGPRFRIIARNKKIIAHSEAYSNKSSMNRTINTLKKEHNFKITSTEDE